LQEGFAGPLEYVAAVTETGPDFRLRGVMGTEESGTPARDIKVVKQYQSSSDCEGGLYFKKRQTSGFHTIQAKLCSSSARWISIKRLHDLQWIRLDESTSSP
jgi:hypothetical protein